MKTPVLNIAPGKVINFHGEPCLVLEHREDGTLLLNTNQIERAFGTSNDFAASELMHHLNSAYLDSLTEGNPDEIITRTVDLTAINGSKQYGSHNCKVAPLTLDEARKYHDILPKPERFEWLATPWSTPNVDDDDTWVAGLTANGGINNFGCSDSTGSRPAFLIPSSFAVEDDSAPADTEDKPLEQYTTDELIAELYRRTSR